VINKKINIVFVKAALACESMPVCFRKETKNVESLLFLYDPAAVLTFCRAGATTFYN